jgi:hypothetical protein
MRRGMSGRRARRPHILRPVPFIEDRIDTVETDIADIKGDVATIRAGQAGMELKLNRVAEDVGELKAGQIEIRDLLARVVARLEGVSS